jgi:hypothetical protein
MGKIPVVFKLMGTVSSNTPPHSGCAPGDHLNRSPAPSGRCRGAQESLARGQNFISNNMPQIAYNPWTYLQNAAEQFDKSGIGRQEKKRSLPYACILIGDLESLLLQLFDKLSNTSQNY